MKNVGDGRRVASVERELQQAIAQFLISGFRWPLPGLVTVAAVKMPADLKAAKVFISVYGSEEQQEEAVDLLQEKAFEIQSHIGKKLKMRFCPKLTFYVDEATEQVLKVEKILQGLEAERAAKGESSKDESDDE